MQQNYIIIAVIVGLLIIAGTVTTVVILKKKSSSSSSSDNNQPNPNPNPQPNPQQKHTYRRRQTLNGVMFLISVKNWPSVSLINNHNHRADDNGNPKKYIGTYMVYFFIYLKSDDH